MKTGIVASILLCTSAGIAAQEVVLTSTDGSISMKGELIEFKDDIYTIKTSVGQLELESTLVDCSGSACPDLTPMVSKFTVEGDPDLAELVATLIPIYTSSLEARRTETSISDNRTLHSISDLDDRDIAKITVAATSSAEGLNSLLNGEAALSLSLNPVDPQELLTSEEPGTTVELNQASVIGLDGIVIVTAKDNPITGISLQDVARVFSGAYTNWSELGGSDAPIKLYGPAPDSNLSERFKTRVMAFQLDGESSLSESIIVEDDVAARVAEDPDGIGLTYYSKNGSAKALDIHDVCGISTPASDYTIKTEEYPLTEKLYAYSGEQNELEHAAELVQLLQSDTAQKIVGKTGWVDQLLSQKSIQDQGLRFAYAIASSDTDSSSRLLATMASNVINSERLSATFRFETGTSRMDSRSQYDLTRLAEWLQSNSSTMVRFSGFTDSVGDFELNKELSQRRAKQIQDALLQLDPGLAEKAEFRWDGYGEVSPIACNETALGRATNRRVEVWIEASADQFNGQ